MAALVRAGPATSLVVVVAVRLSRGGCKFGCWANELITTADALGFLPGRGPDADSRHYYLYP